MSGNYPGNFITKQPITVSTTQASGVWTLQQALQFIRAGTWPQPPASPPFMVETFTATGSWTCPDGVTEVEYLVVAGGGGGGNTFAGGGGAGGFRTGTGFSVTAGTTYTITVGGGGAGQTAFDTGRGATGSNSVFSTITSNGGGGGGSYQAVPNNSGASGGSGAFWQRFINV